MPNAKELQTIVEKQCYSPSINETIFPQTPPSKHWSSSTYARRVTFAWSVSFVIGGVYTDFKTGNVYVVRLVRGGSSFSDYSGDAAAPPPTPTASSLNLRL